MPAPPRQPGDTFLLFHELPYDFREELPLALGPHVFLDNTPNDILSLADPQALADYVLPGYHLPGHGLVQCCLLCPEGQSQHAGPDVSAVFFESITALRLHAPLPIEVAGQFKLGSNDDLIQEPTLYQVFSPWQPDANKRYTSADIAKANDIAARLRQVSDRRRMKSAIVLFAQVTCGHSKSLQMAYLAIFAALEALFAPHGHYAQTLARRVSSYLNGLLYPGSLNNWLKQEYVKGRSSLSHGLQDMAPRSTTQGNRAEAFGRLHEITRLSILGFLSLDDTKLTELSNSTGTALRNLLDDLEPASGPFIDGQRFWLPVSAGDS